MYLSYLYLSFFKDSLINSILAASRILKDHHSCKIILCRFLYAMLIVSNKKITVAYFNVLTVFGL